MKPNFCASFFLIIAISLTSNTNIQAQPGALDTSFRYYGVVMQDIAGKNDYAFATAVQADGKILSAGLAFIDTVTYNDFVMVRYKTNGQLDSSFGVNGIVTTDFWGGGDDQAMSMCLQPDGKIILGGKSLSPGNAFDFALARYNIDGTLDNTFGTGGLVTTDIAGFNDYGNCVRLQSDGKIVMSGYTYNGSYTALAVVRYNANGTLDNTFDGDGIATIRYGDVYLLGQSLAIQNDGKIVATATTKVPTNEYDILVVRLKTDGSRDSAFDGDGILSTDFCYTDDAYSVAVQSDGKIVVAGASYDTVNITMGKNIMLIRYNSDGSVDNSFGNNGKVNTEVTTQADIAYAIAIQSNGKIVAVGHSSDGAGLFQIILTRYHTDGRLDSTFGTNGMVTTDITSRHEYGEAVALQADGKIVVSGFVNDGLSFNMFTARYEGDIPTLYTADLAPGKLLVYPNPVSNTLFIESAVDLNGSSIFLLNVHGQIVREIENIRGKNCSFSCENLSAGLYLMCVSMNGVLMSRQRVVVSEN